MKIKSSEITARTDFENRRQWLKTSLAMTASMLPVTGFPLIEPSGLGKTIPNLKESIVSTKETPTTWEHVTSYNNFYELGTAKSDPVANAKYLTTDNWTVRIEGACEIPQTTDMEHIFKNFTQEERILRFRCVEAWGMVIPWVGFSLSELLKQVKPTSNAKYVKFTTLHDKKRLPGQKRAVLDWPYVEGLRMDEAMHPLTTMVTGAYGEELLAQNGAPLRLIVPWKYGFKSIKSIVKIELVEHMPRSSWMKSAPNEYGFYANVNPRVPHPRWSQARHRVIGGGLFSNKVETLSFNGYAKEVAHLYSGMDLKKHF